jgi:GT2 family glycosyltransferase
MRTSQPPTERFFGDGRVRKKYVLVTAARNEEACIENALSSIVRQTALPERWIIVSDGSQDRTDEIVQEVAARNKFVHLARTEGHHALSFASKVSALRVGFDMLKTGEYDFVGVLDADISVEPDYFRALLDKFEQDPQLGLAGGIVFDERRGLTESRVGSTSRSVAGAVQFFRRDCFDRIGGLIPLEYGGEDWWAEVSARMLGWRVQSFPELQVRHHRPTGTAGGLLRYWFRQGFMDFSLGSDPIFEIVKLARRLHARPYILGAAARFAGFVTAWCRGEERPVTRDFIRFLREEQRSRLRCTVFGGIYGSDIITSHFD